MANTLWSMYIRRGVGARKKQQFGIKMMWGKCMHATSPQHKLHNVLLVLYQISLLDAKPDLLSTYM